MDIHTSLHEYFHFPEFLPGQEKIIRSLLAGHSALAIFPTGQGKSLCYQLTALHLPGTTLVVSPLMALMKDQVDSLQEKGISAARIDSSLSREEFAHVHRTLRAGSLKLLYVAPERFANERFLSDIAMVSLSMLVIDEAHCISEWGHNFRPDYLKLADISRALHIPVNLCLTATATPAVADDIKDAFAIKDQDFVQTGFYRPNLTLRFSPSLDPFATLLERLQSKHRGASIVYVTLQATAEEVAKRLTEQGFPSRPYHAGLQDEERKAVQEWFMDSDTGIVVATIAFGMGIDKGNIRAIYHYNLPKSLENYSQEIGRAGRDGKKALCDLLGGEQDRVTLENFSYGDTPDSTALEAFITMIMEQEERFSVTTGELSQQYDMRPLVVTTCLTYLELEGLITATGPFYTSYKFIPHRSSQEILARFDTDRATFLYTLLSCASKAKKWFQIDLDEATRRTGSSRERIVKALNYLEEKGDLELQVSGIRKGFKRNQQPSMEELQEIIHNIQNKFVRRESQDIERLNLVMELIEHQGCKNRFLLNYFGEDLDRDCGHCEFCLSEHKEVREEQRTKTRRPQSLELTEKEHKDIRLFLEEMQDQPALASPRQQARFFCGLTSPKTGRARLTRHPLFGLFADRPFAQILDFLKGTLNH